MYKLGLDIGGTKIAIGILNAENRLIATEKLWVNTLAAPVSDIGKAVKALCAANRIPYNDIDFCGIGVPGTVSSDGRTLLKAPNISILSSHFAEKMEQELHIPTVMIQDSRAAAWGEYLCGGGKGAHTLICITLGTGIGTGIVIDGRIYHGALGAAGELGHIPVRKNGHPCGCGKTGCLEKYAAGGGLDITAKELFGENAASADLFSAAAQDHRAARHALEEAVVMLGNALVSAVNLLSPDCLLLSGGLCEQTALYLNPLIDYVQAHSYSCGSLPRIEKAHLGPLSPLVGAALASFAP